jgi:hypothetical protein
MAPLAWKREIIPRIGGPGVGLAYALPEINAASPTGESTIDGDRVPITGARLPGAFNCSVLPVSLSIVSGVDVTDRVGTWTGLETLALLFYSGISPAPQVGAASAYIISTKQKASIRYVIFNAESGEADVDFTARGLAYAGATHVALRCVANKCTVVGSLKLLFTWDL